ncbi:hypothetical protein [Paracoccus shanxieyensis]|uniref:Uncharacterized protein n=1 Tax=Paracoccus shanxieyensis TaxID=2675752 RepID=A0A6L6J659_9RHOB|nr:hypothetical protein [Paracoccus shanxieyensis]MTH66730.1 hypothetical protein [Paracoccus shanxieyensis]MTH89965.1 hypothetical protein [Paracoccus shanxieyensis]
MNYHTDTLTLDASEGLVEAEAIFAIDAAWSSHRNARGYRSIDWISSCELESWTFDGRKQTRATAVALIGEAEVERQENLAMYSWRETASQDEADEYADYRHGMAAE